MKDFYKSDETNLFFRRWITSFPESSHPLDTERFHEFVLSLSENGEDLTESILREAIKSEKKWVEDVVEEFVDSALDNYFALHEFYDFLKEKGRV